MTREEAIYYLTWLRCDAIDDADSHKCEALNMAIDALEEEPKTKVIAQIRVDTDELLERVKGEWVMPNKELTDRPMAECSLCGWYVNPKWVDDYNFCPNCGADMRGNSND